MNSKTKLILIGIATVVFSGIIFVAGVAVGLRHETVQVERELNSTQAMLAFNRILFERKLNLLLSKGCEAETLRAIDIGIDQDTELLATLFKEKLNPWISKYIADRDPDLLPSLDKFKSKYGNSWVEKDCAQADGK